jgi:uncharacterized OsmC-like protein
MMNSEELKAMQAPLKDKYRKNPASALVTLKANGEIGGGISCKIETGQSMATAGLHPATGGNGLLACSGDLLLEALVACAGVTLSAVATAIGVKIETGMVKAEGDLDFRGTLGVSKNVPVGFKSIRLNFEIDSNADADKITSLLKLTERYCVVYQTIMASTTITTKIEKVEF